VVVEEVVIEEFKLLSIGDMGIGAWITEDTEDVVYERLDNIDRDHLSKVQLNQLLVLGHEAPLSDGFFKYYWMDNPETHTYPVTEIPGFSEEFIGKKKIISLEHLKWGLYRIFTDGLLYFGNVRSAYRKLRELNNDDLVKFLRKKN